MPSVSDFNNSPRFAIESTTCDTHSANLIGRFEAQDQHGLGIKSGNPMPLNQSRMVLVIEINSATIR